VYGHRKSVDIALFAGGYIDQAKLNRDIKTYFSSDLVIVTRMQNGISCTIMGVKVDIFDWKVPFIHPSILEDGIRIADPRDIFAYKCESVMDRKSEKDFSDIGLLMQHVDVSALLTTFKQRYPYLSPGSVFPFLLKPSFIVKDPSINYLQHNSFEKFLEIIKRKLAGYEKSLIEKKRTEEEDRIKKFQQLIEQKRRNHERNNRC
jgi:hypothetical protein